MNTAEEKKEYIERAKVLRWLSETLKAQTTMESKFFYGGVATMIRSLTPANVAEVVRCKECVYWGGVIHNNVCRRWSSPLEGLKNMTSPDDFCSYGEKKEGEEDV